MGFLTLTFFLFLYSALGMWTVTEGINHPWKDLEPRNNVLAQHLWIYGSITGTFMFMAVSPFVRPLFRVDWKNKEDRTELVAALAFMAIFPMIMALALHFVIIETIGGFKGMLAPNSPSNAAVLCFIGILVIGALLIAVFFYCTDRQEPTGDE
jgi:quinol-cytochrome oxidoreductase complex cytochrome b subunit